MKLTNKYMMFATAALLLASCDLDKYPEGQYVSDNQKEETIKDRPNLVTAEVNAMAAKLNAYGTISDDATTYHNDYGVPAVSMALESGGQDLVALWLQDITGSILLRIIQTVFMTVLQMN